MFMLIYWFLDIVFGERVGRGVVDDGFFGGKLFGDGYEFVVYMSVSYDFFGVIEEFDDFFCGVVGDIGDVVENVEEG